MDIEKYNWRFIVRSKDRISGTPNNFVAQLPSFIPENCDDVYIKLTKIACGAYPSPSDASITFNTNSGIYNQPNLPATSTILNTYGFDTSGAVDLCLNGVSTMNTIDTETARNSYIYTTSGSIAAQVSASTSITIPVSNKNGIFESGSTGITAGDSITISGITGIVAGFTATGLVITIPSQTTPLIASGTSFTLNPAQPFKQQGDKTFAIIPYSRGDNERSLRLISDCAWVKLAPTNFGTLNVKLFNDLGFPLKLRKFYGTTTTSGGVLTDSQDVNIGDWIFEAQVMAIPRGLPEHSAKHKI